MSAWTPEELHGTLRERFLRVTARVPDADAVAAIDGRLTYADLLRKATDVAARVARHAYAQGGRVALLCGSDSARIVAQIGVVLSGRCLVVLDAKAPTAWLAAILADCTPSALVFDAAQAHNAAELAGGFAEGVLSLVPVKPAVPSSAALPGVSARGRDLAAIIYTSGSTGTPKGVMRPHDSFLHTTRMHGEVSGIGEYARFGSVASAGYARSTSDAFAALMNGAGLCIYDFATQGFDGLAAWLQLERITSLNIPIAMVREWNGRAHPPVDVPALRDIRFSGAVAHQRDVEQLAARLRGSWRVWTAYSSSEGGSIARSDMQDVHAIPPGAMHVGRAVSDRTIRLVDTEGRDVEPGSPGELVLSGPFLATGYWNNPELTASRFTTDDAGQVSYRSGDLGYLDADGHLHLAGRSDDVVKVRGFTVAPAAVEAVLMAWHRVAQAAVLPVENARGERELAAYVVPAANETLTDADVRDHVGRGRPAFMVPGRVVLLTQMPTQRSGKPDRHALGRINLAPAPTGAPGDASTTLERVTLAWRDVLRREPHSVDATFTELGGDSFAVAHLERRLSELFERQLELAGLFAHPTIRRQAEWIDALLAGRGAATASPARVVTLAERHGCQGIYMLPATDGSLSYALEFAQAFEARSVYGVEAPLRADGSFDATSFDELARPMARCIAAHASGRPIRLMGPCGGGKLGLEVATHLRTLGAVVSGVVVVEAPGRARATAWSAQRVRDMMAWGWQAVRSLGEAVADDGPMRPFTYAAATAQLAVRRITRPRAQRGTVLERRRKAQFRVMSLAYQRSTYPFPVLLIRGAWSQRGFQWSGFGPTLGWNRHCPMLTTRFVPGTHASVYQSPFVAALARAVARELEHASTSSPARAS
ncbi:MAG: non-ribosomal peptide synthetase [Vicinamibacterales bacterium]